MKSYLFILRHVTHNGHFIQETLDLLLSTAAFEQTVTLLFLEDAVFYLKQNQSALLQHNKTLATLFNVLPLYEINALYSETESLNERGLQTKALILPVTCLARAEIGRFMQTFDVLIAA